VVAASRACIEDVAKLNSARTQQFVVLQHQLTDLIDFLDPDAVRAVPAGGPRRIRRAL
jgi:hypothetical protein